MPCLCKQWRSRSNSFWRSQLIWICTLCHNVCEFESTTWIKLSYWLKIRSKRGILFIIIFLLFIYLFYFIIIFFFFFFFFAWQGLKPAYMEIWLRRVHFTLRKHAYSNTLKILPRKNGNFSDKKFWYFSYVCSKHRLWVLVRTASPF